MSGYSIANHWGSRLWGSRLFLGWLLLGGGTARADEPLPAPWDSAIAYWSMADEHDQVAPDSPLQSRGEVELGVELDAQEQTESLARGGDGRVARLSFGWLDAGDGENRELQLEGEAFTAAIRLQAAQGRWSTRGLFTRGGGHDALVFNFFSHDFSQGSAGMRVGCEIGIDGQSGLGAQVTASVPQIGADAWHDLVARYDGQELVLFVDGVPMDRKPCTGRLRQNTTEPLTVGAGTHQGSTDSPFIGLIDHAAIWNRALSDEEIVTLSGGPERTAAAREKFASWIPAPAQPSPRERLEAYRSFLAQLQSDRHLPRWHFVCPEAGDAMPFDPNGMIYWSGRYHLFYIFQADSPHTHYWGHASSVDLVHWTHHPTALAFGPDDPDRGIFSGNAFLDLQGRPTILYHGVDSGNSIAQAQDDDLIRWQKSPTNPLVPIPKPDSPDFGKYESWDPHGWVEQGRYKAIFGGAKPALFEGNDLQSWRYVGPFFGDQNIWGEAGEDVSCPDFFPIGERHMLLCISHRRGARYFLGRWDGKQFYPEVHERMNWPGGGFFAPETMLTPDGRRILIAWVMDPREPAIRAEAGWSGVMSMPRELSLGPERQLEIRPARELERLRLRPRERQGVFVPADQDVVLEDIVGDSLELEIEFDSASQNPAVVLRRSPDGQEQTVITYDRQQGQLSIDFSRSSLDPTLVYRSWCIFRPDDPQDAARRITVQTAPLTLADHEPLRLRIFLDRSILEVFANDRQCVTQRIFPTRDDATGVALRSERTSANAARVRAWTLAPARLD